MTSSTTQTQPDLSGWLGAHHILRMEYGRIARAAGEVGENDTERIAALEDTFDFMTRRLLWHHQHEDDDIFPSLRRADASLADMLDDLEQDHTKLDELLVVAGGSTPLPKRASAMRELHRTLSAHLDREEADAVPAILRLIPASAWALGDERFHAELGADRDLTLVWLLTHMPEGPRAQMLADLPPPVQEKYATEWEPAQRANLRLMYGDNAGVGA